MGDRRLLSGEKASATVEFFLILPLLVLVLVAGTQVIGIARTRIELLGAVREGARVAATVPDPSKAVDAVRSALDPQLRDRTRISVSRPGVVGRPARVKALIVYPLFGGLLEWAKVAVTASASMYVEG